MLKRIILILLVLSIQCVNKESQNSFDSGIDNSIDNFEDKSFDIFTDDNPVCIEQDSGTDEMDIQSIDLTSYDNLVFDRQYDEAIIDVSYTDYINDFDNIDDCLEDIEQFDQNLNDSAVICPSDMVSVNINENYFCVDKYEASRPDATEDSYGSDNSKATSRASVLPWFPVNFETAKAACESAGKRLCTSDEWTFTCHGTYNLNYCYGNEYDPIACNGIDAFCSNPAPKCGLQEGGFHVTPTGSFEICTNDFGIFDINGNVWEWVIDNGTGQLRGGAYNCGDSATLHACSYIPSFSPSARGFRCCKDSE